MELDYVRHELASDIVYEIRPNDEGGENDSAEEGDDDDYNDGNDDHNDGSDEHNDGDGGMEYIKDHEEMLFQLQPRSLYRSSEIKGPNMRAINGILKG